MDHTKLREYEDRGVMAVRDLDPTAQWSALETLVYSLHLRPLTQVDVVAEKLKAFKRETESK